MSPEENELITRVEGAAPMGRYLREHHWFPAVHSSKLVAGGAPVRVRLLGENFAAWRADDGRPGFFREACPHRRASLLLARNEDNALRCIFHGWKYGVDGTVLEVPTEPRNQAEFCKRVPLRRFPLREACGILWVWLGEGEPGAFPDFEFMSLPADQTYVVSQTLPCNWVQDVEGGTDSAHVAVLHKSQMGALNLPQNLATDLAPTYEFEEHEAGYRYVALRKLDGQRQYARVNLFVMPWYCLICPEALDVGDRLVIMSTPVDDYNVIHWMIRYNPDRKLSPSYANPAKEVDNWPPAPVGGPEVAWGQDRVAMANNSFTGFSHINTEDFAVAVSQGTIVDRSEEFLNQGDLAVVRMRRLMLAAARGVLDGETDATSIPYGSYRASGGILPEDANDWRMLRG